MNGSAIETVAQTGYEEYHRTSHSVPWKALSGHQQARWIGLAARILNGESLTPQQCRERYFEGYSEWSWENVTPRVQVQWTRVRAAMTKTAEILWERRKAVA